MDRSKSTEVFIDKHPRWRELLTSLREILQSTELEETIENQRQGKIVKPEPKPSLSVPSELAEALGNDSSLKSAYEQLAPYKQREYAEFIAAAKRADTRTRRLEKILPMIRDGKGLNDRYRC